MSDLARVPYRDTGQGFQCALLVRRSLTDPSVRTFYLTHAPADTPLSDLVRIAGKHWTIETNFEQAKGKVALVQYAVRSYVGWHRHVTLAMLAHAYLASCAGQLSRGVLTRDRTEDLIPLTVPEIRHLLVPHV